MAFRLPSQGAEYQLAQTQERFGPDPGFGPDPDDPTLPPGSGSTVVRGTITEVFVIPEPSTALLVGLGLVALGARRQP